MPYLKIETNQKLDEQTSSELALKASGFISGMLGKPESYVMVSIDSGKNMTFGGSPLPAAFIRLKSIGLPTEKCAEFAQRVCQFVHAEIQVSPDRVFIDFCALERNMFGWNGKTF
jgi:phenylpyruvate tautomerase PptA (4-oxalocrotonate tautomerase family)